jgi:fructokinase
MSEEDMHALRPGVSVEAHSAELLNRSQCELVVVTLGENGSVAFTRAGQGRAGIWAPPVFGDTVGAGDSLMAGILSRLAETGALAPGKLAGLAADPLTDILQFGAIVAGLNCQHKGCNPPTRAQVDAVLVGRHEI